jgi:phosphatidylglycerol:prolipoprotein diacylglycerol transferase
MFPVLRIGPLALQTAGLAILLGFWLALELAARQGARQGFQKETVHNAGFYGAIVGIIGARLGYAIAHWSVYRHDLLGLVALNPQTLHPLAGLGAGAMVAVLYLRKRGGSVKGVLDAAAPGLAVFMGLRALADFFSGQALGATTTVPWALSLWGESRHPVQLYELGLWILGAALIWRAGRSIPAPGELFMLFAALYGAARVLVEPFRAQGPLILGGLRAGQVVGFLILLAALWLMQTWWRRSPGPADEARDGTA